MIGGRLLLLLVVLSATIAVRQPALAADGQRPPAERTTWVQRLGHGVTRSFSRIGLMQRVTLRVPSPQLVVGTTFTTRPAAFDRPDPLRTCLPPPAV